MDRNTFIENLKNHLLNYDKEERIIIINQLMGFFRNPSEDERWQCIGMLMFPASLFKNDAKIPVLHQNGIGAKIREYRKQNTLTLAQLSERIGVNANSLCQYETGRSTPRQETAAKILAVIEPNTTD